MNSSQPSSKGTAGKSISDARILLVDDDQYLAQSMAQWLGEQGIRVDVALSKSAAQQLLRSEPYDLMLVDLRLGGEDGFEMIAPTVAEYPNCAVLVITGYATPDTAIQCVRAGAFDLLTKPLLDDELMLAIERALTHHAVEEENQRLREQLDARSGLENILSHDYRMLKIFDIIDNVADAKASVLITGENGTGKSMIARAVHRRSHRRGGPFIEVACGALPDALLESELFGHVAGAFTGANTDRVGKFELADTGTLFLDEIGTATQAMQVKLLRVLQQLQFEALGGTETKTVDTRVILATNEDLSAAVARGDFRQDLFYRINVVNIAIPPLRERRGDIPLLVEHFLRGATETCGRDVEGFDADAMEMLHQYSWPGNVRELENVVQRAVLLGRDNVLGVHDLPVDVAKNRPSTMHGATTSGSDSGDNRDLFNSGPAPAPVSDPMALIPASMEEMTLREALEGPEREIILRSLRLHHWNRIATADALGINRTTLYKKMKRLGLDDPRLQMAR